MHPIERFYRQYRDDVYRYLLGLARDPNLAEDLLSETFLEALRALPAFRGESTAKTWLFGIARNVWLRQLQKGRAHAPYAEIAGRLQISEASARVIDFRTKRWLRAALEKEGSL